MNKSEEKMASDVDQTTSAIELNTDRPIDQMDEVSVQNNHRQGFHDYIGAGENSPEITPGDSVSNISYRTRSKASSGSSNTSSRLKLEALKKEIELKAELSTLEEKRKIECEKFRMEEAILNLNIRKKKIELEAKLRAAKELNGVIDNNSEKKRDSPSCVSIVSKDVSLPQGAAQLGTDLSAVFSKMLESQRDAALPSHDIKWFDGSDILTYQTFIKNFEYIVEKNTSDPTRRLEFLLKYTKGEAHELIKFTTLIEPAEKAYREARTLLFRDYGNPQLIAAAFSSKAQAWPKIQSGDKIALRKFSIFLISCVNSKQNNVDMLSLDGFEFIRTLCQKLPIALQQGWINEVGKIRENENRSPILNDFEKFVSFISRNENDPRICGLGYQSKTNPSNYQFKDTSYNQHKPHIKRGVYSSQISHFRNDPGTYDSYNEPNITAFSSQIGYQPNNYSKGNFQTPSGSYSGNLAAKAPCLYCQRNDTTHSLLSCRAFSSLNPSEKSIAIGKLGLCYACLNPGHRKAFCKNSLWARCDLCSRQHATAMHDPSRDSNSDKSSFNTPVNSHNFKSKSNFQSAAPRHFSNETEPKQPIANEKNIVTSGCVRAELFDKTPLMAIIPVQIKSKLSDEVISTYAFVDNGCGTVLISSELSSALKVRSKPTEIILKTINLEEKINSELITDTLEISGIIDSEFYDLPNVFIKDNMPISLTDAPQYEDLIKWKHLKDVTVPKISGRCIEQVTIMIGISFPTATVPLEVRIGDIGEPYAIRSPLGWLCYGLKSNLVKDISVNFCQIDNSLEDQFKKFINLEFAEKLSDDKQMMSLEDKRFLKVMEESIELKNNHYVTELPLRNQDVKMPYNKLQAEMFAYKLNKKLKFNSNVHAQYTKFMEDLEVKHYSERVPECELDRGDQKVWFIPHHNVINPKKPEKTRVVFNCPVSFQGMSLNSQLLQGPDLTNTLIGVIMRFRQHEFAMMADIESMFYQIRVAKKHCDLMRYLWWPKGDLTQNLVEYRMLVHIFGATSSPSCSNFALKRVASDNVNKVEHSVIESINNDFYVDDFLKSLPSESDAIILSQNLRKLLKSGGFNLTKWVSNSRELLKAIPESDRVEEIKNFDFDNNRDYLPVQRALGVTWSVETDTLQFNINVKLAKPSKRNILSITSSVYDPFGFASPFILLSKLIMQNLCREKLGWDEDIPDSELHAWEKWLKDLPNIEKLVINRCLHPKSYRNIVNIQLHHFSDASQEAYGMVTYIRYEDALDGIHVSFLIGRSRVAPLRPHSIVKLELAAATSIVKMNNMLIRELSIKIDKVYFWTDSQTILKYIANEKQRHQVFVSNRLGIIRDGSNISQWKYVPSKLNPADHATRGLSAQDLSNSNWLSGPEFLLQSVDNWPENSIDLSESSEINVNVIKISKNSETVINQLLTHTSDWIKLKRSVSWFLRLKTILYLKSKRVNVPNDLYSSVLSVDEIKRSEHAIIEFVQRSCFSLEYNDLLNGETVKSSILANLDPIIKNNLICVGGRLKNANIPIQAKHQIILPKDHYVSKLIVWYTHKMVGHQGRNHVIAELRQQYWIVKVGVLVKSLVRNCIICRRLNSNLSLQKMADLPASRVTGDERAFKTVGVDFFGHFEIKIGRSIRKRYGVIFSCFTTRAIHIEIAESLETGSCISAIRRFICRRGIPKEFHSDNGTNLVSASKELKKGLKDLVQEQNEIVKFSVDQGFKWSFNPPSASHFGGVWERQIRTIRKILRSLLCEQYLKTNQNEEQLRTLMCEVEFIVNSRPLTKVSNDVNDLNVISPNSLLLIDTNVVYPPGIFCEKDVYAKRSWRQIQYLCNLFWKRWSREYLPMLQCRQKWLKPCRNYKINDVVLIVDDSAPRCSWPMGRIVETYSDKNGLVRSVKLKTKTTELVRPIHKLVLLLEQDSE